METKTMYENEFPKDWTLAAYIDEGESYEVDRTTIYQAANGDAILATASGCSCWDGDWDVTVYPSLQELLDDLGVEGESDRTYNPSFKAVESLKAQVEAFLDGR